MTQVPIPDEVDVVVVGAGVSGIGVACHLRRRRPATSFVVLEARDAIGGTWDLFRYPGIRSDSDLHTYGYEFKPWTDPDAIASGDKILRYLEEAVAEHDLGPRIRFGCRVVRASWSSTDARWTVEVARDDGAPETVRARWLVGTTGYFRYDRGYRPDFAGIDDYRGVVVDPQRWPADLALGGARVVVIGSGATAATLVPALADEGARVTMLQRSPGYYVAVPRRDPIANLARRHLSPARAYAWTRRKNVATQALFYRLCRAWPERMGRLLVRGAARLLPDGYDVARDFTPAYGPWDQRLCLLPDGDLLRAIASGRATVVTDTVDTFTSTGIRLSSGEHLSADVVVCATGLELLALGDIAVDVDGVPVDAADRVVYKSAMLSDVPNLVFVFGYTNASWTLKVDLIARWLCRCLAVMDRAGDDVAVPVADPGMPTMPMLDLTSGYVQRAIDRMPRQGVGPWAVSVGYRTDARRLRRDPVDDGVLRFTRVRTPAG